MCPVFQNSEAEAEFTPDEAEGTTEIEFTFKVSDLFEGELVVFEKVYDVKGNLVGVHEDLTDEGQTVKVTLDVPRAQRYNVYTMYTGGPYAGTDREMGERAGNPYT